MLTQLKYLIAKKIMKLEGTFINCAERVANKNGKEYRFYNGNLLIDERITPVTFRNKPTFKFGDEIEMDAFPVFDEFAKKIKWSESRPE